MEASPVSLLTRKNCTTCRQPNLFTYQSFKNCGDCREKNRQKTLRAAERKLAWQKAERALLSQRANLPDSDSDSHVGGSEAHTSTGTDKRKTPLATRDFLLDIALKRAKGALMKSEHREWNLPPAPFDETSTAYQSATSMYSELKDKMCKRIEFSGHHSVVVHGDIDDAQRVEMTRNDLRKIVRLPFDYKNAIKLRDAGFSLRFKCKCLGRVGDVPRKCGGKVIISARADRSHPLVPGQVVSVSVTH